MKFIIRTYGCQMNVRDSEASSALLTAAGHQAVEEESDAQLIIVNSCSVRGKAEDKAIGKLRLLCVGKAEKPDRIVGVSGCMVQRLGRELFKLVPGLDFAIGTRRNGAIPYVIERLQKGEKQICELGSSDDIPDVPTEHTDGGISAFVTILLGCNRRCSYCIVPDVRGSEYSRPAREILAEIEVLVKHGIKEVTLLGQSVINYGRSNEVWAADDVSPGGYKEPFTRLLEAVAAMPGIKRVRYTSGHPVGCSAELVRLHSEQPVLASHLHLPLQSGSDRILKAMRRGYTREDYLKTVQSLRAAVPGFALTTDIIVGYPGETVEDFEATRSLMQEAGFDNAFIFKYSPRPGTPAAALEDDVSADEKMRRNQVLLADQDARGLKLNEQLIGSVLEVLAEGPSLRNAARWSGRSSSNKIVVFEPLPSTKVGDMVSVRITRAAPQTVYGTIEKE